MEFVPRARLLGVVAIVFALVVGLVAALAPTAASARKPADDALTEVSAQKSVTYPAPVTVTAGCPSGYRVGFGGWTIDNAFPQGSGPSGWAFAMEPVGKKLNKWAVSGYNRTAAYPSKLTSYGYCFKGDTPKVVTQERTVPAAGSDNAVYGDVTATCPKKTTLIGGAWGVDMTITNQGVVTPTRFERSGKRAMVLAVYNEKEAAVDIRVTAICGKGKKPTTAETKTVLGPHEQKSGTAKCPKGQKVLFGGFRADYDYTEGIAAFVSGMRRAGKNKITVTAGNPGLQSDDLSTFVSIAYCR